MSDVHANENDRRDEALLMDVLLGQADPAGQEEVARRLAEDPEFRRRHEDAAHALSALRLMPAPEPPADLTARTLGRISGARRTEQLLDQQEIRRRRFLPRLRIREIGALAAAAVLVAALILPSFLKVNEDSRLAACADNLGRKIAPALQRWEKDNDGKLPGTGSANLRRWWPAANEPAVSNSSALFSLVRDNYVPGVAFACPTRPSGSFEIRSGMLDFPAEKYVSYSYQHSVGPARLSLHDPRVAGVLGDLAIMADANPIFADGRIRPEKAGACSENHAGAGQNVLFADGKVRWCTATTVGVAGDDIYLAGSIRRYTGMETPIGPTDSFLLPTWSAATPHP